MAKTKHGPELPKLTLDGLAKLEQVCRRLLREHHEFANEPDSSPLDRAERWWWNRECKIAGDIEDVFRNNNLLEDV